MGVTLYRALYPAARADGNGPLGLRNERLGNRVLFVLPNPSGRNAAYPYPAMLAAFRALRRLDLELARAPAALPSAEVSPPPRRLFGRS